MSQNQSSQQYINCVLEGVHAEYPKKRALHTLNWFTQAKHVGASPDFPKLQELGMLHSLMVAASMGRLQIYLVGHSGRTNLGKPTPAKARQKLSI